MVGDSTDMQARLRATLPVGWFADQAPVLTAILAGLSSMWVWFYDLLAFVRAQTRVMSASVLWLDLIAQDYFGNRLQRAANEQDAPYRQRILKQMVRAHATRAALIASVQDATGFPPIVFEPANPQDTGGWGVALGYGVGGGWGSLSMPFQAFVTARRPAVGAIAGPSGWGGPGGYGGPSLAYGDGSQAQSASQDAAIYAAITSVLPAASIAWTQITN